MLAAFRRSVALEWPLQLLTGPRAVIRPWTSISIPQRRVRHGIAGPRGPLGAQRPLRVRLRRPGAPGALPLARRLGAPGALPFTRWLGGPRTFRALATGGFVLGAIRGWGSRARSRVRAAISLSLVEPRAGVFVLPAGPPLAAALLVRPLHVDARPSRLFRCVPYASAREPLHHDVRILSLQLMKGRLYLFSVARAKGGRLVVDENGPVRVTRGHLYILRDWRSRRAYLTNARRPS